MRLPVSMLQAAVLVAAAALGWVLRGYTDGGTERRATAPRAEQPRVPTQRFEGPAQPLIAVASDGRVTLRVEQQPLEWVLEEIARQEGHRELRVAATAGVPLAMPASAPTTDSCPAPEEPPRTADLAAVLMTIENGSEADRHEALLQARNEGLTLPPQLLRTVIETGASERVRLRALEAWVEQHADRPAAVRSVLEGVVLMPGTQLAEEARRMLGELQQLDQVDPSDTQPRGSP